MNAAISAVLGVVFLGLAIASTLLMFQFWGYPYDKATRKSACPQWKMNIHRVVGFAFVAVYVLLMIQMVPRMWTYQVEFPPRTVAHIMLGISIGVLLMLKIVILRWFRHFEEWMPFLGVAILLCTFLLVGLSVPFVVKERALAGAGAFTAENRSRVAALLPGAGLPDGVNFEELTTVASLRRGRKVLLTKCIYCHDLRTAISKPRTPRDWVRTVVRMADKPTLGPQMDADELAEVSVYLIAITPELQDSVVARRRGSEKREEAREAVMAMRDDARKQSPGLDAGVAPDADAGTPPVAPPEAPPTAEVMAADRAVYEDVCSQCHGLEDVDAEPPTNLEEVDEVIERMVDNGLEATAEQLARIRAHMIREFAKK